MVIGGLLGRRAVPLRLCIRRRNDGDAWKIYPHKGITITPTRQTVGFKLVSQTPKVIITYCGCNRGKTRTMDSGWNRIGGDHKSSFQGAVPIKRPPYPNRQFMADYKSHERSPV